MIEILENMLKHLKCVEGFQDDLDLGMLTKLGLWGSGERNTLKLWIKGLEEAPLVLQLHAETLDTEIRRLNGEIKIKTALLEELKDEEKE